MKKKLNDNDQHMYLNTHKEDPNQTSADRLLPLSNRKLWKIKHKKPLHNKNKRLEKKGIF